MFKTETDPILRPPCTAEQFEAKLKDLEKTIDGIRWALATDSEGKLSPGAYVEAGNLIMALVDGAGRLLQPLREVETPVLDREAVLLAAVDLLSPHTRYGYVTLRDLNSRGSHDARFSPSFYEEEPDGSRHYRLPLYDTVEALVAKGVLEKSATGDIRRPGAKGQGAHVGESRQALYRRLR